jgi:hypothetical protein
MLLSRLEKVTAFLRVIAIDAPANRLPQPFARSHRAWRSAALKFRKGLLDRVDVGTVGGR